MSDYLSKLKRGSGLDSYGNAYQFPYEKQAVSEIERLQASEAFLSGHLGLALDIEEELRDALEAKDKRIAELEKTNAQLNHDIGEYVDETARLREKLKKESDDV